jgi:hypothetical protein
MIVLVTHEVKPDGGFRAMWSAISEKLTGYGR